MTQAETNLPQTIAGGRYLLVEPIGEGGMATVYRGFDQRLQVWRAVKVLNPRYAKSKKVKARFDAEAQTMALLEHPNIVRVYDVGSVGDISFIVMELVEGGTLVDWLERWGAMPPGLALHAIDQVCAGIDAAHSRGVVHRDIKPHNVLVTLDGTCRVTDFGIARVGDTEVSLTKTGAVMGTWGYMAPEQRSDAKNVDERADVYAIAATLYTLVTNRIPMDLFAADRDASVMSGVPETLFETLLKATDYDKNARYPNVKALRQAFAEVAERAPSDPPRTPQLASRRPDRRGPPSPDVIAKATPLVPTGSLPAPTILPTSSGMTGGESTYAATTGAGTVGAGTPVAPPPREPSRKKRSPVAWLVALVPLLLGLLLFAVAGVVLIPVILDSQPRVDTGTREPVVQPAGDAVADPVDDDTDSADAVPVQADPDPAPDATPDKVPDRTPVRVPQGTPDPAPVEEPPEPAVDTDAAEPTGTPDPDPGSDQGTADDPDATAGSPVEVKVVPEVQECIQGTAPPEVRVGAKAPFSAKLCSGETGKTVTLWFRPAGTGSWRAVGLPFRLGAYRGNVDIDERFTGGIEYYIETDGATWGSRSGPRRVSAN